VDWAPLLAFAALTLLASVTPGPAVLLTMAHGVKSGFGASLKAALGVQAGNGVYFTLSAVGLGAILAASESLFHAIKWIGAGYLVYLGARTILRAGASVPDAAKAPLLARPFQQAAMSQLANPKSVLFFGALMPQFIQPGANLLLQYVVFAALCFAIEMPVLAAYGWLAAHGRSLFATPRSIAWRERLSGGALVVVGASLAAVKRSA
jgi:homoserine/homoserine lactone efflux protein